MLSTQQIDEDLWEFASSSTDTIVVAQCKNIIDEFPGITGGNSILCITIHPKKRNHDRT